MGLWASASQQPQQIQKIILFLHLVTDTLTRNRSLYSVMCCSFPLVPKARARKRNFQLLGLAKCTYWGKITPIIQDTRFMGDAKISHSWLWVNVTTHSAQTDAWKEFAGSLVLNKHSSTSNLERQDWQILQLCSTQLLVESFSCTRKLTHFPSSKCNPYCACAIAHNTQSCGSPRAKWKRARPRPVTL